MKNMSLNCLIVLLFVLGGAANARSLWNTGQQTNYADPVAIGPGDLLTIEVSEQTQGQTENNREREKSVEMGGSAGVTGAQATIFHDVLSYIPLFGPQITGESTYESERTSDAFGSLSTTMTVRVETVRQDGILELRGTRRVKIDDEIQMLEFSGLARQEDVRPDNTIPSHRIANADISYEGKLGLAEGEARGYLDSAYLTIKNTLFY
jgi:flagellar L-ring protein precursor FlgH